jgi:hypothetical protein
MRFPSGTESGTERSMDSDKKASTTISLDASEALILIAALEVFKLGIWPSDTPKAHESSLVASRLLRRAYAARGRLLQSTREGD